MIIVSCFIKNAVTSLTIKIFVKNYIAGCTICQQMKINTHPSSPTLTVWWVVDHSSMKGIIYIFCHKTIDVQTTTQNFINHMFQHFSLPSSFLSNRCLQFSSQVFKEIAQILSFRILRSMAYHSQTNRETECVNQELEVYMHTFCSNNPETWSSLILIMEFCYNQKLHSTTKKVLFFLSS